MKKVGSILKIPILILFTFTVQLIVSNNFQIFGITPNIILVAVVIISMWYDIKTSIVASCVMGILADLIFHFDFGKLFVSYLVIAILISYISKKYRKDSKTAIVYITIMATCLFSGFKFIYYIIDSGLIVNIFALFKQVVVEILLNIAIAYILYKILENNMKDRELSDLFV